MIKKSWREWMAGIFKARDTHHRVCRLCGKTIKKNHKWRQVRVGRFGSVYAIEHRDCRNPSMYSPYQLSQRLFGDLPFEGISQGEHPPETMEQKTCEDANLPWEKTA